MFYFSSLRFFSLCKASSDLMRAEKAKYHILVNKVTNCMFFEIESRICFLCLKVSPGNYLRWTRSSRKWLHAVANANRIIIITFDIFITTFQQPSIPLSFTPRLSLSFFLRTHRPLPPPLLLHSQVESWGQLRTTLVVENMLEILEAVLYALFGNVWKNQRHRCEQCAFLL